MYQKAENIPKEFENILNKLKFQLKIN